MGESLFSLSHPCLRSARYRLGLAFHDQRFVTRRLIEGFESTLARPGRAAAELAAMRSMHFAAQQKGYARLEAPALLLWGREDAVTSVAVAERLSRDLRARLVVYPRCGHFPMIEASRASNRDLREFLAEGP